MSTFKVKVINKSEGIFIPKKICEISDINWREKALLATIYHFDQDDRVCFASDAYFAAYLGCSIRNIRKMLLKLESQGFICRSCKYGKRLIGIDGVLLDV